MCCNAQHLLSTIQRLFTIGGTVDDDVLLVVHCRNSFGEEILFRLFASDAVDDKGNGSVAGDVAGCAKAVHGYVDGYHQSLHVGVEAEHAAQQSEGCHDGSAWHAGCGDHGDAQHHDEAYVGAEVARQPHAEGDGVGHGGYLEDAAGHVDGGAEGDGEAGSLFAYTVLDGLLQGDGDGGS